MAQFSLTWEAYKNNICTGLSTLQQNGEFVDMTLAADGHHVKVHQLVLSLVSPYIKELIASASCQHPVIFLSRVSYPTLCAILEYVYTGEVLVAKDQLGELIEAAKELHIKGLLDMKLDLSVETMTEEALTKTHAGQPLSETGYFKPYDADSEQPVPKRNKRFKTESLPQLDSTVDDVAQDDGAFDDMDTDHDDAALGKMQEPAFSTQFETQIQYTTSSQGALQMILNRCLYCLRYTSRRGPSEGHRQWRCIAYNRHKCRATVVTKDDVVIKRFSAHNHPFHDKQILKRVQANAVYSALNEAAASGKAKTVNKQLGIDLSDKDC